MIKFVSDTNLKSRKSIYEQVIDNVKELIVTGVLPAESKLPSVRELSKTLTVNPNTVQKGYRELEHQGYIYTVTGLGCFVAAREEKQMSMKMSEADHGRTYFSYKGADVSRRNG